MGSLWLARAQWLPSDDLFMWLACVWYATEPTSEKQWLESKPDSNVCRCIPNWGIAFLVIAISIWALLSLLSHFKLSLISLRFSSFLSLSHSHTHLLVLRHTRRVWCLLLSPSALSPPPTQIFHSPWLTLIQRLNMWVFNTFLSCLWETGREETVYPHHRTISYLLRKVRHKHAQMRNHVQMRADPKH